MNIENLRAEQKEILNTQQVYYEKILNELEINKLKVEKSNKDLESAKEEIEILNLELQFLRDEKESYIQINEELRNQIIRLESEIYSLSKNNENIYSLIMSDLKDEFLHNNDERVEEILDEVLDDINNIECNISYEDMMLLMYLSYFYDRFEVLFRSSSIANSYHSNNNKEIELLNIVRKEEHCKTYTIIEECTQDFISKNNNILSIFNKEIKNRIIEKLNDFSYKAFENVYSDSEIDKNDKTSATRAWIKNEDNNAWKLVNGFYSKEYDKFYIEPYLIQGLIGENKKDFYKYKDIDNGSKSNEMTVSIASDLIRIIKENFLEEKEEKFKKFIKDSSYYTERNIFGGILSNEISDRTISKNEGYTVLLISVFYGVYNMLLNNSNYLMSLYKTNCVESRIISLLEKEILCDEVIDMPSSLFIMKNNKNFKYIDDDVIEKISRVINLVFYKKVNGMIVTNKLMKRCYNDKNMISSLDGYLEVSYRNQENKYLLIKDKGCSKCNTIHIQKNTYQHLKKKYGFIESEALIVNDQKSNLSIDNTDENKFTQYYDDIITAFKSNNIRRALLNYNKIIENEYYLKYCTEKQAITLLFIGYIIKGNTFGADEIKRNKMITMSIESILYNKIITGGNYKKYLIQNINSLDLIDSDVSEEITKRLLNLKQDINNITLKENEDFDGNTLSAESEIKKLGYSTSIGREKRWSILKNKVIPMVGKSKTISHISFLIRMNRNRTMMENAVRELKYDLERLEKL
ncbi:MAG: hypothetical protein E7D27_05055 [Clostridium celatum]|nr:hypothetical protein [Clostridium celatum]